MLLYVHTLIQDELESRSEDVDEMELVSDAESTGDDEGSDKRSSDAGGNSSKASEGTTMCSVFVVYYEWLKREL
jgi:hypothetical protein